MNEIKQKQVLFFRKGKNYYYKYGEKISKVDAWTINLLKESLTLPYNVGFIGYSRAQIGRIISYLYEDGEKAGEIQDYISDLSIKSSFNDNTEIMPLINHYELVINDFMMFYNIQ